MTDRREEAQPRDGGRDRPEPLGGLAGFLTERVQRRQERIRAEIEANRRGEYTVPTWVLSLALALMVGALIAIVVFF